MGREYEGREMIEIERESEGREMIEI